MTDFLSVEELVIDDSFHNYCFQKNETDIFYWEQFILDYPSQKDKIEEAKKIVLGLHVMLQRKYSGEKENTDFNRKRNKSHAKIFSIKKNFRYAAAVAAVLIAILISKKLFDSSHISSKEIKGQIASNKNSREFFYKTRNGERKMITLSDHTKIWLNAASELRVDKNFDKGKREVYLSGEALFEVVHNEAIPFIVHTDKYDVKDLGTVFNVRAYASDKESETSLIKGKVEIHIANGSKKIFLSPNQKAVVNNTDVSVLKESSAFKNELNPQVVLLPLTYDQKDSTVVETAWSHNRLEIVNENFYEIQDQLERWFNVKIMIKDEAVGKYPFTATFEKENIQEVLEALQYAYHFNYSIKGNEISISK